MNIPKVQKSTPISESFAIFTVCIYQFLIMYTARSIMPGYTQIQISGSKRQVEMHLMNPCPSHRRCSIVPTLITFRLRSSPYCSHLSAWRSHHHIAKSIARLLFNLVGLARTFVDLSPHSIPFCPGIRRIFQSI
jgi:hypothetical protein